MSAIGRVRRGRPGARAGRGVLAIDIRRDVVYLVHLEGRRGRPTRARFLREPIDASLYSESPLEAAAAAVGRITRGLDLRRLRVAIVLPNNRESVRVRRFPALKRKALASAVGIAMQGDALLRDGEPARAHYVQRVGQAGDGTRFLETVLVEASGPAVAEAQALARLAGLRLAHVASASLSLGRAAAALSGAAGTNLVIDLFGPATTLSVFQGDRFLLSREGDVATDLLSGDLETFLALADLPAAAAEPYDGLGIRTHAAAATATAEPVVDPALPISSQKLLTEIERTNRYLMAHFRHTVDRVFFAGPSALASTLCERIQGDLGVPVALFAPEGIVPARALDGAPTCSSARCLGAALGMLAPGRERRYELLPRSPSAGKAPSRALAAAVLVVVLGTPPALLEWKLRAVGGEAEALRARLARATEALVLPGEAIDPQAAEARIGAYRRLRGATPRWSSALAAVAAALPPGVWLTEIVSETGPGDPATSLEEILTGGEGSEEGAAGDGDSGGRGERRLRIAGRARSFEAVSDFLARLEATGRLRDPRLVSMTGPVRPGDASPAADAAGAGAAGTGSSAGAAGSAVPTASEEGADTYRFVVSCAPDLTAAARAARGREE